MKKLFFLLSLTPLLGRAQDTLFAVMRNEHPVLLHTVKTAETLPQLAQQYAVVPESLQWENGGVDWQHLTAGKTIRIPLGPQNMVSDTAADRGAVLLYRCPPGENLQMLSGSIGLPFEVLQHQNKDLQPVSEVGRTVVLGYLRRSTGKVDSGSALDTTQTPVADTTTPVVVTAEMLFEELRSQGAALVQATGPVAFFTSGAPEGTYYALHPTAPRGAILRVRNPDNGRVAYAKVIGPLPNTKVYAKAIVAVSQRARQALGSLGDARLWCEVVYAKGD